MSIKFFSPVPVKLNGILGIIRILVGGMLLYHGLEIFQQEIIDKYLSWEVFKGPNGVFLVYFGKMLELLSGIFLVLGFLTRVGAAFCIGALSYVTFMIGHGKVWYEDQHPFLLVLFGFLFLFAGPGAFSLDHVLFRKEGIR